MTAIRFVAPGGEVTLAEGPAGSRLLDVAQAAGQPLEGTCGGDMACATCHVLIDAAGRAALPPPSAEEEDLLDLVAGATRDSRLACQVRLPGGLPALTVRIPG